MPQNIIGMMVVWAITKHGIEPLLGLMQIFTIFVLEAQYLTQLYSLFEVKEMNQKFLC